MPPVTLTTYRTIPEDFRPRVEIEDGRVIVHRRPSDDHRRVVGNLVAALGEVAAKRNDAQGDCLEIHDGADVMITEAPRLHLRKTDTVVRRRLRSHGPEQDEPLLAGEVVIAAEVVSASTKTTDFHTKRMVYAEADIPHYWIIHMAGDDGVAVMIERLVLTSEGSYVYAYTSHRDRDTFAVNTLDPFRVTVTWDQLDRGFPVA
jgi:Uma2 family endonuclease